jgi:hypothetical protein
MQRRKSGEHPVSYGTDKLSLNLVLLGVNRISMVHTRMKGHILCRSVTGVLQCNGANNPCDLTVDRNPCYGKGSDGDVSALFRDHDFSGIKRLTIGDFLYRNYGFAKLRG